jgi:DDE_Tnp_1-associated
MRLPWVHPQGGILNCQRFLKAEGFDWGSKENPMTISFLEQMKVIPDHRITGVVTYPLDEILLATLVDVLCGADDWEAIELLSREYLGWLK